MDIVAVLIFVIALALIGIEWVHRTKVALAGAALMVLIGVLDQNRAIEAVDWATLGLLAGMMVIVGLTEPTESSRFSPCGSVSSRRAVRSRSSSCSPSSLPFSPRSSTT